VPGSQHRPRWSARSGALCGHSFSVSAISAINAKLDEGLAEFARRHHKHSKSTNLLERLNEEIKRRPHVGRIFPNAASCLRLIRALAVAMHDNWLEAHRYLNLADLREHQKEALRLAA
jgi:transposase-like protein